MSADGETERGGAVDSVDKQFILRAVFFLREDYLPKILEAVALLSEDEMWTREGATSNSVGNLLLHLSGNVRQHIISGVGGVPDHRNRPEEFAARGGIPRAALVQDLEQTVREACAVLEALDPALLLEDRVIQNKRVLLLDDIFHVIEHFAYHTGQIVQTVKTVKTHAFPWYNHLEPKA
jgi:uncharacterized damage-inducible protein DinB